MPTQSGADALRLIKKQIEAGRARIERRVQFGLEKEDLDEVDVWDAIIAADDGCIDSCGEDRDKPERTVVILRLPLDERDFYCKVSINLEVNHDPMVLSFKPWTSS